MATNPFANYGNKVRPEEFCGRKEIVRYIFDRISQGASVSVVGERRTGKTSLLHYIMSDIAMNQFGIDSKSLFFIYVDCFGLTKPCPRDFWLFLLEKMIEIPLESRISESLKFLIKDLRDSSDENFFPIGDIAQLLQRMKAWGRQPVFLLDEFESVINTGSLDGDFLKPLRSLATSNPLTFVVATRDNLEIVCHSDLRGSPFFNIFGMRELHIFSNEEFYEWLMKRLEVSKITFGNAENRLLIDVAGRHPFFSEMFAYSLFYSIQDKKTLDDIRPTLLEDFKTESRPHFEYYWAHSSDGEKVTLSLLALKNLRRFRKTKYEDENIKSLIRRSLVLREGNDYLIFSSVLAQQIRDDVYSSTQNIPEDFEIFLDNFKSSQPKEIALNIAESAKAAFRGINPKYWGVFLEYLINRENPTALLELLQRLSQ